MADDFAFVISQIGAPGSDIRARTDELCDFVLREPLRERGLRLARADEDPTPGTVTEQIVRSIVSAKVVIADLTGRNPNVYYELGIAHSFAKPLIILVDATPSLAFDLQGERAIPIGDDGREIGARKAAAAADEVRRQLDVVLEPGYTPHSLVRGAGMTASLERFASTNPISAQLVRITEQLEELKGHPVELGHAPVFGDARNPRAHVTDTELEALRKRLGSDVTPGLAISMLRRLTPAQATVIEHAWGLDGGEGMSPRDIAMHLNISPEEAASLLGNAIASLFDATARWRTEREDVRRAEH